MQGPKKKKPSPKARSQHFEIQQEPKSARAYFIRFSIDSFPLETVFPFKALMGFALFKIAALTSE